MPNKYRELTQKVIEVITSETDVPAPLIISKTRTEEVVGVRHMAIMILHRFGLYPRIIAECMGMSQRAVQFAITNFDKRLTSDKLMRNNYARVLKKLGNTLEITNLPH